MGYSQLIPSPAPVQGLPAGSTIKTLRTAGNDFDQHGSSLTEDQHAVNGSFNQHSSSRRRIDTLIHCKRQATTWISVARARRRIDGLIHQSLRLPIQSRVYMRCERARMSAASHPFLIFGILVSSASVRAAACHVNTCWRTLGVCAWCWCCWTHSPA